MDHRAGHIEDIVKGLKTIESRWSVNRIAPWGRIQKGDRIYFKESGGYVIASALAGEVLEFENLDRELFKDLISRYADDIRLATREYVDYYQRKRYVILIRLTHPQWVGPFTVDKSGYGISTAWMCVGNIDQVRVPLD